jgi:aryl-alcohol dehydrogenase-like predicted oxidoreductase
MLRYKLLGHSGLRVAEISLGAMTFGEDLGWGAPKDVCRKMFDHYADLGGNFIDTANGYTGGTSEKMLGEFVKSERSRYVIATKFTNNTTRSGPQVGRNPNSGGNQRKSMHEAVNASLERLDTDYIDLYWMHMWDQLTPVDEVMRGLDDLVRAGKVLYVGVSNAPAWWIARANTMAELRGWTRFVGMQIEYSLAERTVEQELIPLSRALDIGVVAWSPLAGGVLTGKYGKGAKDDKRRYDVNKRAVSDKRVELADAVVAIAKEAGRSPAQVALAWLMAKRNVIPIIGARTMEQYLDNMGAAGLQLNEAQMQKLEAISKPRLGYPQSMLGGAMARGLLFNQTIDRLDRHRDEGGMLDG